MKKVTLDRVLEACDEPEFYGFCKECGHKQAGVEPDAENYVCEYCGHLKVCGTMVFLMEMI